MKHVKLAIAAVAVTVLAILAVNAPRVYHYVMVTRAEATFPETGEVGLYGDNRPCYGVNAFELKDEPTITKRDFYCLATAYVNNVEYGFDVDGYNEIYDTLVDFGLSPYEFARHVKWDLDPNYGVTAAAASIRYQLENHPNTFSVGDLVVAMDRWFYSDNLILIAAMKQVDVPETEIHEKLEYVSRLIGLPISPQVAGADEAYWKAYSEDLQLLRDGREQFFQELAMSRNLDAAIESAERTYEPDLVDFIRFSNTYSQKRAIIETWGLWPQPSQDLRDYWSARRFPDDSFYS